MQTYLGEGEKNPRIIVEGRMWVLGAKEDCSLYFSALAN
jgi:hypothetical protein